MMALQQQQLQKQLLAQQQLLQQQVILHPGIHLSGFFSSRRCRPARVHAHVLCDVENPAWARRCTRLLNMLQALNSSGSLLSNKKQREVYVGNLTIGVVTDIMLRDLFNSSLAHLCGIEVQPGQDISCEPLERPCSCLQGLMAPMEEVHFCDADTDALLRWWACLVGRSE